MDLLNLTDSFDAFERFAYFSLRSQINAGLESTGVRTIEDGRPRIVALHRKNVPFAAGIGFGMAEKVTGAYGFTV